MNEPLPKRSLTVDGNRLTLLTEGPERLDALLALIDGAERSLRLLFAPLISAISAAQLAGPSTTSSKWLPSSVGTSSITLGTGLAIASFMGRRAAQGKGKAAFP